MRVAVACDGLEIASHFIQCTSYMCYTVDEGIVVDSRNTPALDRPLDMLPAFFEAIGADVLITGQIDEELAVSLASHELEVVSGACGSPLEAVRAYLAG